VQWKINAFIPIQNNGSKLAGAILRLIEHQRNGQGINQGLVKKVLDSFVSLGLDEDNVDRVYLDVYQNHFEIPFLEQPKSTTNSSQRRSSLKVVFPITSRKLKNG